MANIFYEGTLQSGIGQAIQQQKLVACFIRGKHATTSFQSTTNGEPRWRRNKQAVGRRVAEERLGKLCIPCLSAFSA